MITHTRRAILDNIEITSNEHDVAALLNCDERAIAHFNLRRGDVLTIETVTITAEIVSEKEHSYGFDGLKRERAINKSEFIDATQTIKLWKTPKRGWYWK
jgi:hypothetical protein